MKKSITTRNTSTEKPKRIVKKELRFVYREEGTTKKK